MMNIDADIEVTKVSLNLNQKQNENMSVEMTMQPLDVKEEQGANNTSIGNYVCLLYVAILVIYVPSINSFSAIVCI